MPYRYRSFALIAVLLLGITPTRPSAAIASSADALNRAGWARTLSLLTEHAIPQQPARSASAKLAQPASDPGSIAGTLSGLDPEAYPSATITAWLADSTSGAAQVAMAAVAPDGQYRVDGLAPGRYYVSANAKGYQPRYYDNAAALADAATVAVAAGQITGGIDFAMDRLPSGTGAVSGVVRVAADGHPVAGATVHAYAPDNPFLYAVAPTDADGRYEMIGLPPGTYVVEVWANGYLSEYYDGAPSAEQARPVAVVDGQRTEGVDFELEAGGSITGYVRHADGTPIPGATVQAQLSVPVDSAGAPVPVAIRTDSWTVTDESGFYRLGGMVTGSWRVLAQASTRWFWVQQWYPGTLNYEEAATVPVTFGAETGGIDFVLALPALRSSIAGRVTDGEGRPVVESFVSVQSLASAGVGPDKEDAAGAAPAFDPAAWVWAYATTDKEGYYAVGELPAGRYVVGAAAQAGWEYVQRWHPSAASVEEATPLALAEGQSAEGIDVVLPIRVGTASLSGAVRDQSGTPLVWAYVDVTPAPSAGEQSKAGGLYAYAQTDSQGVFRVDRLPAGSYIVHASYGTGDRYGQGWWQHAANPEAATPVVLTEGANATGVDFDLVVRPLYGMVTGTVTDQATGAPLSRAYVELAPVARNALVAAPWRWAVTYGITDEKGRYELTWVPEGQYALAVYANGGAAHYTGPDGSFPVVGGETVARDVAVRLRYDGDGAIAGKVKTEYGGPLLMDTVKADPAAGMAPAAGAMGERRVSGGASPDIAVVVAYPAQAGAAADAQYTAVTAADGTYALRGLPPGDYAVMGFAPGCIGTYYGGTYAPDKAKLVHVEGSIPVEGIDFALAAAYVYRLAGAEPAVDSAAGGVKNEGAAGNAGAAVYGKVTDAAGNGVANATVYLLDANETPTAFGQTGPDGSYELTNVSPGGYRVYASKLGLGGAYNGNARSFAGAEAINLGGGYLEVNLVLAGGASTAVTEDEDQQVLPTSFELRRNYPNPFNPATAIGFSVPIAGRAVLRVYNSLGQQVAVLFDGPAEAGRTYQLTFDAAGLSSGTYLYTLESGGQRRSRAMSLLK